jgi:hypothetical protein
LRVSVSLFKLSGCWVWGFGCGFQGVRFKVYGMVSGFGVRVTHRLPEKQRTPAPMIGGDSFPARLLMRPSHVPMEGPSGGGACP